MIEVRNESDFTDYLDSLLNQVESEDLEFKSAAGGFPGSFWDTYSAFANSEGGTIILGVAEKEVQRMFADANISNPADSRILHNYSMDDLDQESIAQYRQLFKLAKPSHPWSSLSNFDFLKKLGAYRKDRNTKEEGFTVAGLLMFGKSDAITDNEGGWHSANWRSP